MKTSNITLVFFLLLSTNLFAETSDTPWIFRGTVAYVAPNDDSGQVLPGIGANGVNVDAGLGLGLSLTYMMNSSWGIELLAASPFSHDISGNGALNGLNIGKASQLPPTLSLTYNWGDTTRYHIGAGLNYTLFFQEKTSSDLTAALGAQSTSLKLDASTGLSLQLGFDIPMSDSWDLSATVYWKDIDTTADVFANGTLATSVDVQIDPIVWTLGFSTRF